MQHARASAFALPEGGAFIQTCRNEAWERRLTIGVWPDWLVTAALDEAKRLKREIDWGRAPLIRTE